MSPTLRRVARWLVALLSALSALAHAECPSAVLERFIPADCEACWSAGAAPEGSPFVLDWIVPSPRGDDAALAAAALGDATARAGALAHGSTLERRHRLPASKGLRVTVEDGPAWNRYMGLLLRVQQRQGAVLPDAAVGYLALVENVRAGDEGTPIERSVVRALAGPLALDGARETTEHLVALRIPMGGNTERLGAVGWVETVSGEVIALGQASGGNCNEVK